MVQILLLQQGTKYQCYENHDIVTPFKVHKACLFPKILQCIKNHFDTSNTNLMLQQFRQLQQRFPLLHLYLLQFRLPVQQYHFHLHSFKNKNCLSLLNSVSHLNLNIYDLPGIGAFILTEPAVPVAAGLAAGAAAAFGAAFGAAGALTAPVEAPSSTVTSYTLPFTVII